MREIRMLRLTWRELETLHTWWWRASSRPYREGRGQETPAPTRLKVKDCVTAREWQDHYV